MRTAGRRLLLALVVFLVPGLVVAQGPPEEIVQVAASHTGRYLKELLADSHG